MPTDLPPKSTGHQLHNAKKDAAASSRQSDIAICQTCHHRPQLAICPTCHNRPFAIKE